jgi:multiple sugar transport system substrate-binding protein
MTALPRRASRTAVAGVAILTAGALALTGCGRSDETPDAAAGSPTANIADGPATGEITVWAMGTEGELLPGLVKQFEQQNPEAKVKVTAIPWNAAHNKFTTAITAQSLPDAAMIGTTWMGEFANLGALAPTPGGIDTAGFFPGAQETTQVDGVSYGVPWYVETRLVYYRKDLAEKAGVTTPPTDWDGLKSMAQAIKKQPGVKYAIGLQPGQQGAWQSVMPFAWSNGAELMAEGDKEFSFDTPQMTEALDYYQSFFTEKLAATDLPPNQTEANFVNGTVPMFVSGPWMISSLVKLGGASFKDKIGVLRIPKKVSSTSFVGGSNFVVFKQSKNADSAWKLTKFLTDPKVQADWYQQSSALPSVKSAWQDPRLASDPLLAEFGKQLEDAKAPPSIVNWEQVATAFDTEIERLAKSGQSGADTAKATQTKATSIGTGS